MTKTHFFAITFKKHYEIINYGKCFNQLQTVLCSNCFTKCLNQIRDCSSLIEYCLNYNEVCLSICQLLKTNRGLVKSKRKKLYHALLHSRLLVCDTLFRSGTTNININYS